MGRAGPELGPARFILLLGAGFAAVPDELHRPDAAPKGRLGLERRIAEGELDRPPVGVFPGMFLKAFDGRILGPFAEVLVGLRRAVYVRQELDVAAIVPVRVEEELDGVVAPDRFPRLGRRAQGVRDVGVLALERDLDGRVVVADEHRGRLGNRAVLGSPGENG